MVLNPISSEVTGSASLVSSEVRLISEATFNAVIYREGSEYVARCLELGIVSQGSSKAIALENLSDATALFLEVRAGLEADDELPHVDAELVNFHIASTAEVGLRGSPSWTHA